MKRSARLVLAKETLVRLSPDDLVEVNGGSVSHMTCLTPWSGVTYCRTCVPHVRTLDCESSPCTKQY